MFSIGLAICHFHHVGEMRCRLDNPPPALPCYVNMRPRAGATVMYLRARGRRVGCAQRSKLRFALRARENEEVDIEFLRISCACIRSLTWAQASSRNSGRCTSFSLNLHTSLMRHPSRLPRPTVVEALRMNNPRCSKGALALAPRHDFSWAGNPCFASYSPGLRPPPLS